MAEPPPLPAEESKRIAVGREHRPRGDERDHETAASTPPTVRFTRRESGAGLLSASAHAIIVPTTNDAAHSSRPARPTSLAA